MAKKKLPVGFSERSNGLLQLRFVIEGKRYTVYGSTIKECREKELNKRRAIDEKLTQTRNGPTVEQYLDDWIEYRVEIGKIKGATARTYKKILNRIKRTEIDEVGTKFGKLRLIQVDAQQCKELQKKLRKELTTRTVNDSISLLKQAFKTAQKERIISWNPLDAVERMPRSEAPARDNIHRCLTEEEVSAFMDAARETWYYNLYMFLLHTGMRIGEASALYQSDIKGDIISINKTVTRTSDGYVIAEQTKTDAGKRTVPLRPEAKKAIDNQKAIQRALSDNKVVEINAPIFRMPKGGVIRPDRVNTDIAKVCKKAGIEKFTCHAFRATFTSRCVADRVPIKELMEILGHTDVEMTLGLYAHSNEELKRTSLLAVNI